MQITIQLADEEANRLQEMAATLGVNPSELAGAAVADLVLQPRNDFQKAAQHVLQKNKRLYERLA